MLSRCALYADTTAGQAVYFRLAEVNLCVRMLFVIFVKVLHDISVRRLGRNRTHRSGTENIFLTEKDFGVFMSIALIMPGEVQVDIGRFVTVEAEEGFKRDIVPVIYHFLAAFTVSVGHIEAGADTAVKEKYAFFAFRAAVMRRQRVDLRNSAESRDER